MTKVFIRMLVGAFVIISSASAAGRFAGASSENNQKYNNYYFFTDKTINQTASFNDPAQFARESLKAIVIQVIDKINLLVWQEIKQPLPVANEPYDRKKHFGTWIVDGRNGNCLSTRAEVLVRDSRTQVGMTPGNKCIVGRGKWLDPYGNRLYSDSKDIQIDHMVPLKHAYIAGGWKWDSKLKCLYSNYKGYRGHLVSASGFENQSKSDSTPYSYLPPNSAYVCTYLAEWLKIKLIWNLAIIPPEAQAIAVAYKKYNCTAEPFQFAIQDLRAQRQWMQQNYNLCDYNVAPDYYANSPEAVGM